MVLGRVRIPPRRLVLCRARAMSTRKKESHGALCVGLGCPMCGWKGACRLGVRITLCVNRVTLTIIGVRITLCVNRVSSVRVCRVQGGHACMEGNCNPITERGPIGLTLAVTLP